MKNLYLIAALTLISVSAFSQNYFINSAVKSGNWSDGSSWQSTVRQDNKKVNDYIIPSNIVISLNNNTTLTVDATIDIYGTLQVLSDNSLSLTAASKINLKNGKIIYKKNNNNNNNNNNQNNNNKKEQITIGGVVKYDAAIDNAISGNLFASQATSASPFGFSSNSTLPVNFISFNATKMNDAIVSINWATSEEINNSHFEIQRSIDGSNWSAIAVMFPDTENENIHLYKYNDKFSAKSIVYYRIRQIDIDGKEKFSSVKIIGAFKSTLESMIYVSGKNTVTVDLKNSTENNVMVRLISLTGVIVSQKTNNQNGEKISLTASNAIPGAYIVQVTDKNGMFSSKKVLL